MDPVTLTFYAAVCGLLSAFAPDKAGRVPRFAIGVAVGLVAAGLLPVARRVLGI